MYFYIRVWSFLCGVSTVAAIAGFWCSEWRSGTLLAVIAVIFGLLEGNCAHEGGEL